MLNNSECRAKDPANCEHPNCPNGGGKYSQEVKALLGVEHKGFKGAAAIDKLLEEKNGHVKNAFYHPDVGEIDVFWGDKTAGLCHIIEGRNKQGLNGIKFVRGLDRLFANGKGFESRNPNRYNIAHKGDVAVITFDIRGHETTALLTSFRTK